MLFPPLRSRFAGLVLAAFSLALTACEPASPSGPAPAPTTQAAAPPGSSATSAASASASSAARSSASTTARAPSTAATAAAPLIEWMIAPEGDVAELVTREAARARTDGRTLLVYVGATWCEPCQHFHVAAENNEITGDLPQLRLLEFDLDRDAERLAAAGYASKLIPLFALPGADGRGTTARVQGAVKGSGAVSNIVPRLQALLARAKGS